MAVLASVSHAVDEEHGMPALDKPSLFPLPAVRSLDHLPVGLKKLAWDFGLDGFFNPAHAVVGDGKIHPRESGIPFAQGPDGRGEFLVRGMASIGIFRIARAPIVICFVADAKYVIRRDRKLPLNGLAERQRFVRIKRNLQI